MQEVTVAMMKMTAVLFRGPCSQPAVLGVLHRHQTTVFREAAF